MKLATIGEIVKLISSNTLDQVLTGRPLLD